MDEEASKLTRRPGDLALRVAGAPSEDRLGPSACPAQFSGLALSIHAARKRVSLTALTPPLPSGTHSAAT